MWQRFLLLGVFCLCFSHAAAATVSDGSDNLARLKQEHCSDGNMMQMSLCMSREANESDARLNIVYARLMEALRDPRGLRLAQRAWIAYRDAECRFRNEATKGGSIHGFATHLCLMQLTEQRISVLEDVRPCNGCVEFKARYHDDKPGGFILPKRNRVPASIEP